MFASKTRPIVFPQSEHVRLAGAVAETLERPCSDLTQVSFPTVVRATFEHDRAYRAFDTFDVTATPFEQWVVLQRSALVETVFGPEVDILVALHIKNLAAQSRHSASRAFVDECEQFVTRLLDTTARPRTHLEVAAKIVSFCDMVAYDFCLEEGPSEESINVPSAFDQRSVALHYRIEDSGIIRLSPWSRKADEITSTINAYPSDHYRRDAEPIAIPYRLGGLGRT